MAGVAHVGGVIVLGAVGLEVAQVPLILRLVMVLVGGGRTGE